MENEARYGDEPTYIVEAAHSRGMSLNEYQRLAMTTCMESCDNISYMLLNLVGEVGEFASKVAKHIRKGKAEIVDNRLVDGANDSLKQEDIADLRKEAGDCLWQIAGLCRVMGWTLDDVAKENLSKFADRKARGAIDSNGDNR